MMKVRGAPACVLLALFLPTLHLLPQNAVPQSVLALVEACAFTQAILECCTAVRCTVAHLPGLLTSTVGCGGVLEVVIVLVGTLPLLGLGCDFFWHRTGCGCTCLTSFVSFADEMGVFAAPIHPRPRAARAFTFSLIA